MNEEESSLTAPETGSQGGTEIRWMGLLWTLVRTDFKTRYHGTVGGYLWALMKPLTMFIVLLAVFSVVFSMDPDYNLNLVLGLFLWDFFAESTKTGMGCLQAKGYLVTKARVPIWLVVASSCSNALVTLMLFAVVMCAYQGLFRGPIGLIEIALFFFYLLLYVLIAIGISLAASVLFLRYRDLNQVWDLALQAGFFIAPVIYPLDIIPHKFHFYFYVWPPTPVIQFSRELLVQNTIPSLRAHLMLVGVCVTVLGLGSMIFRHHVHRALEEL